MFGVSFPELLFVMVIALILFGPERLPAAARSLGRFMGELKRNTRDIRKEFYNSIYEPAEELRRDLSRDLKTVESDLSIAEPNCEEEELLKCPEDSAKHECTPCSEEKASDE